MPGYDALFRVVGVAVCPDQDDGIVAYRAIPGTYGGLAFRHGAVPGGPVYVYPDVPSAWRFHRAWAADRLDLAPVRGLTAESAAQVAADAGPGEWVVVAPGADFDRAAPEAFALAAAMDADLSRRRNGARRGRGVGRVDPGAVRCGV